MEQFILGMMQKQNFIFESLNTSFSPAKIILL